MADVLGGFAERQPRQFFPVVIDETCNQVGVGLGVLAKCPPDRLPDEELLLKCPLLAKPEQSLGVRVLFCADLTDDGRPPQPHVVVIDPIVHSRPRLVAMVHDQVLHHAGGGLIDEVPPGPFGDHPAKEGKRIRDHVLLVTNGQTLS